MESRELRIKVPDGYEIDRENSTFECIKLKKKSLAYTGIANNLFYKNDCYFIGSDGGINRGICRYSEPNNATSAKQLEKLLAINALMNVAKYLNGDWRPDWENTREDKFFIIIMNGDFAIRCVNSNCGVDVYFKTRELAQQAIDIFGEDTIRMALSTDW